MGNAKTDEEEILLVQWGDSGIEYDDISEVKLLLEATLFSGDSSAQARNAPLIAEKRITDPCVVKMGQSLRLFLASHKSIQVLYFSCHGSTNGLSYDVRGTSSINYANFAALLRDGICQGNCVHLIMGSCEAMSNQVALENQMPRAIHWVSGFTGCPGADDVAALVAGHIQDDVALMSRLASASKTACDRGLQFARMNAVVHALKAVVASNVESPEREIRSDQGQAIVVATRNAASHGWSRQTIELGPFSTIRTNMQGPNV